MDCLAWWKLKGFSKLEIIFCALMAENNFVNALIPFIGAKEYRK